MLDCRKLDFSPDLSDSRTKHAEAVFGKALLLRLTVFMLFVLGLKRSHIAKALGVAPGTIRTLVKRAMATGLQGSVDHRGRGRAALPAPPIPARAPAVPALVLHLGPNEEPLTLSGGDLHLPTGNDMQRKVVLLSLMGEGMLGAEDVARVLKMSVSHVRRLHRELSASGVEAVLDKRRGQLQDYRVTPELKGEMIAEFVLELAGSGRASSVAVAQRLSESGAGEVSERTVRHHLKRLGLNRVRASLASALQAPKKGAPRPDLRGGLGLLVRYAQQDGPGPARTRRLGAPDCLGLGGTPKHSGPPSCRLRTPSRRERRQAPPHASHPPRCRTAVRHRCVLLPEHAARRNAAMDLAHGRQGNQRRAYTGADR